MFSKPFNKAAGAPLNRREFLRIVAAAGAAGLALKFGLNSRSEMESVSETRLVMGTLVNLTLLTPDKSIGREVIQGCLDRMLALEGVLSRYLPSSQLALLNRDGVLEAAHPALLEVLTLAQQVSQISAGAFDISIKPLLDLYTKANLETDGLPSSDQIQAALSLVDYRQISLEGQRVQFLRPGMAVSLDGIAKGYIVDQGVAALRQSGFSSVYVEAGGDLLASGERRSGEGWKIGIRSPRSASEILARLRLQDQAAATSGDYQHYFSSDFSHHHILDPHTGRSATELSSATVLAPTAALADALATTLMVLGVQAGQTLLATLPTCHALLITKDQNLLRSRSFPS